MTEARTRAFIGPFRWETAEPGDAGMDAKKLQAAQDQLARRNTAAFLVVRQDRIVWEWYRPGHGRMRRHSTASLAKALVGGITLLLALTDRWLEPDDLACRYVKPWQDDPVRSRITIRQLATHSSAVADAEEKKDGQKLPHDQLPGWKGQFWARQPDPFSIAIHQAPMLSEPGTQYAYSNPGFAALAWAVTAAYQGTDYPDLRVLLRERVMRPIGLSDDEWSVGYDTTYTVDELPLVANWGGGRYTARAVASIGRLMLARGIWQGNQLLDPAMVDEALCYPGGPAPDRSIEGPRGVPGLCWWLNSDGAWADVPRDAFAGAGAQQQVVLVVPSLDLIVIRNGGWMSPTNRDTGAWSDTLGYVFQPVVAAAR